MVAVDAETLALQMFSTDAFVMVNKKFLKFLGGDGSAAVFLGELVSCYKYNLNMDTLDPDTSFPIPIRRFYHSLGLSASKQARILKILEEKNLCSVLLKKYPAQKYVIIKFEELVKIMEFDEQAIKRQEQAEFYADLNTALNALNAGYVNLNQLDKACGNINYILKGSLVLISRAYRLWSNKSVVWTPESLGKIRQWVRNRAAGKPFDFTIVTRTLQALILKSSDFDVYVSAFLIEAKNTADVHYSSQMYDFEELVNPPNSKGN